MNTLSWRRIALATAFLMASAGTLTADPALTLTPSPDLAGAAGSIVGWGFNIVNDTADYLEFSSSQFCLSPVILTPVLACTAPTTGVYYDIITGNDPVIGPHSSLAEDFDPLGFTTGAGYFVIDPSAPYLASDIGQLVLIYDGYDANPNLGPANQVLHSVPLAADASVTVTAPATPVPEPSLLPLLAAVLATLALFCAWTRRPLPLLRKA